MAYAVIGGLMVATLLTLVFLPALYVAWFRIQPVQTGSDRDHRLEASTMHPRQACCVKNFPIISDLAG